MKRKRVELPTEPVLDVEGRTVAQRVLWPKPRPPIAHLVRQASDRCGLPGRPRSVSLELLGAACGVSDRTFRRWREGGRKPTGPGLDLALVVCEGFVVLADSLDPERAKGAGARFPSALVSAWRERPWLLTLTCLDASFGQVSADVVSRVLGHLPANRAGKP